MMQHPFFWPTKTLILDDNERYLDEMKQLLSNDAEFILAWHDRCDLEVPALPCCGPREALW